MNTTEILKTYLREVEANSSAHTLRSYATVINRFIAKNEDLELVTVPSVRSYITELLESGMKTSSVNHHIRTLKVFWSWLEDGYVESNPFSRVKLLREPKKIVVTMTKDEIDAMMNAANGEQERLMLLLLLRTGLRVSEAAALKVSDIIRGEDGICRISVIGKGDKEARIPLAGDVCERLLAYLGSRKVESEYVFTAKGHKGQITSNAMSIRVKRIISDAGLPEERIHALSAHKLRATFITGLARNHNKMVAQHAARHSSPATTDRYINVEEIGVEAAILGQK